jgi:hypothetical protein
MSKSNVFRFSENFDTMSAAEYLSFIDRLEHLPQKPGETDRKELASIRLGLDDLEKRVRAQLANA